MSRKNISILSICLILVVFGIFVAFMQKKHAHQTIFNTTPSEKITRIAACPTYYELSEKLDLEKYLVIKTNSTAESIALLQSGQVDLILAGRTLKPDEPHMDSLLIKKGYSFLHNQSLTIFLDQLENYNIYTDLNAEELKKEFPIQSIQVVDDVYEYTGQGIVITSWENTDYSRANIVHLLEKNRNRYALSRQATIYCPNVCGEQVKELALYLQ